MLMSHQMLKLYVKDMQGKVIQDNYRIGDFLGAGAFGMTFKAKELSTGDTVAIKILDKAIEPRFRNEAKLNSMLRKSRYVPTLYTAFKEGESFYIVMEYVPYGSIRRLIREAEEEPIPVLRVIELLKNTCIALDEAHTLGIIHRDIKPENILISNEENNEVKITDFGLARLMSSSGISSEVGTPGFMAPEIKTGKYDHRVDIYSTGVILYQLLGGDFPIDVSGLRREIPLGIRAIIRKGVEDEPSKRYSSVKDMLDDLAGVERKILGLDLEGSVDASVMLKRKAQEEKINKRATSLLEEISLLTEDRDTVGKKRKLLIKEKDLEERRRIERDEKAEQENLWAKEKKRKKNKKYIIAVLLCLAVIFLGIFINKVKQDASKETKESPFSSRELSGESSSQRGERWSGKWVLQLECSMAGIGDPECEAEAIVRRIKPLIRNASVFVAYYTGWDPISILEIVTEPRRDIYIRSRGAFIGPFDTRMDSVRWRKSNGQAIGKLYLLCSEKKIKEYVGSMEPEEKLVGPIQTVSGKCLGSEYGNRSGGFSIRTDEGKEIGFGLSSSSKYFGIGTKGELLTVKFKIITYKRGGKIVRRDDELLEVKSGAEPQSDGIQIISDNFNHGNINTAKWTTNGWSGGTLLVTEGKLYFKTGTANDQQIRTTSNIGSYKNFTITFKIKIDYVSGDKNVGFWLGNLATGEPGSDTGHRGYYFQFHGKTRGFNIGVRYEEKSKGLHDKYDSPKWNPGTWYPIKVKRSDGVIEFYFNSLLVGVDKIFAPKMSELCWVTGRTWKDPRPGETARIYIDDFLVTS